MAHRDRREDGMGSRPAHASMAAHGPDGGLRLQVALELSAAGRVAQLAERLGLDLADPLAGDVELLAHFLEGPGAPVLEAEPELEHAPLAAGERVKHRCD